MNVPESKEFDVGDDLSLNLNDVRYTRCDLTIGNDLNLTKDKKPKYRSTNIAKKGKEKVALQNDETFNPARKVRFHVPESETALPRESDAVNTNHSATTGRDDWISWLFNPLFDPIATCGAPCREISKSDIDIASAISLDSTYSNLSALFVAHSAVHSIHPDRDNQDMPPVIPSLLDASSVLGIRDLNSMNDDSSLNSPDGSIVGSSRSIFRQNQESQRRARATWNSLQHSLGKRGIIYEEGTVEV